MKRLLLLLVLVAAAASAQGNSDAVLLTETVAYGVERAEVIQVAATVQNENASAQMVLTNGNIEIRTLPSIVEGTSFLWELPPTHPDLRVGTWNVALLNGESLDAVGSVLVQAQEGFVGDILLGNASVAELAVRSGDSFSFSWGNFVDYTLQHQWAIDSQFKAISETEPFIANLFPEGSGTLELRFIDRANQLHEISIPFEKDTTPPEVERVDGNYTAGRDQVINFTHSDVVEAELLLHGETYEAQVFGDTLNVSVRSPDAGTFSAALRATDSFGNIATSFFALTFQEPVVDFTARLIHEGVAFGYESTVIDAIFETDFGIDVKAEFWSLSSSQFTAWNQCLQANRTMPENCPVDHEVLASDNFSFEEPGVFRWTIGIDPSFGESWYALLVEAPPRHSLSNESVLGASLALESFGGRVIHGADTWLIRTNELGTPIQAILGDHTENLVSRAGTTDPIYDFENRELFWDFSEKTTIIPLDASDSELESEDAPFVPIAVVVASVMLIRRR